MHRNKQTISEIMRKIHSSCTKPEMAMRQHLRKLGIKYKSQPGHKFGNADFLLRSVPVLLFIDGDFWHGKQWKMRGYKTLASQFKSIRNSAYWTNKIQNNMHRDKQISSKLRRSGWSVVRFWESDLNKKPQKCMTRLLRKINSRGSYASR